MKSLWKSKASFALLDNANEVCRKLELAFDGHYFLPYKTVSGDRYGIFSYDRLDGQQQEVFEAYVNGYYAAIEGMEWEEGESSAQEDTKV